MRFLVVVAALAAPLSANAANFDLSHRECTDTLSQIYGLPDAITLIYRKAYESLEEDTSRPTEEKRALTEQAWDIRRKHMKDWQSFAVSLRSYCETLE